MGPPGVLRVAAFRNYFAARTISSFGGAMSTLAVAFAVLSIGGSAAALGLVFAAGTVPALVLVLLGGVAGDRWERRRILLAGDLVMTLAQGALALALLTGVAEVWHFVAAAVVGGAAMAFSGPTNTAILPGLVDADDVQQANSVLRIGSNISKIVGPAAAGVLVALTSPGWALAADAGSFLVSPFFISRLPRSRGVVRAGVSVLSDVRSGWQEFTSRRWVWLMVLSFGGYQATMLPIVFVLGPVIAEQELNGASSWALVLSARAVGALAVGFLLFRWRPHRPLVASTAVILLDVPFVLALVGGLPIALVVLAGAASSAGLVAADTLWESTLQERVPGPVLSRVSSYDWLGSMAINPLGFALVGFLAESVGLLLIVLVAVGVHVVVHGLLLVSPSVRGVRRASRPLPEPM